jgi:hypothetical protein
MTQRRAEHVWDVIRGKCDPPIPHVDNCIKRWFCAACDYTVNGISEEAYFSCCPMYWEHNQFAVDLAVNLSIITQATKENEHGEESSSSGDSPGSGER